MWSPSYEIIVETLTGSEFEVTVSDRDTVGYIKSKIQKYEGIPVSQQHLVHNHRELADATEMRDVPLVNGSRLKLVLGMKGGPISSKRVVTIADYENWFDMSDVLSRQDAANFKTPGLKLLVNKKNIHRLMKVRAEKASDSVKGSVSRTVGSQSCADLDAEEFERETQKERDDKITAEKLNQIKTKLNMKKKKHANGTFQDGADQLVVKEERSPIARPTFSAGPIGSTVSHHQRPHSSSTQTACLATATREPFLPHINFQNAITTHQCTNPIVPSSTSSSIRRAAELDRHSQIRENLQRNRSFKTISAKNLNLSGHDITARDSSRLERSLSYHSQGILNRMDSDPTAGCGHASAASYNSTQSQHQLSSASLADIIELLKYNPSKLRTISHDALNKMVSKKHHHGHGHASSAKLRDYDVTMTNRLKTAAAAAATMGGDCATSLFGSTSATDSADKTTFRTLYKSTSDDNSTYELPKLLIREDSPVESFHSSYPQLETVAALRGESPKNLNPAAAAASAAEGQSSAAAAAEKAKLSSGSLLQLYEHPPPATTAIGGGAGASSSGGGGGGTWAPHYGGVGHHHHSDLGINELELKFVNNGLMEKGAGGQGGGGGGGSVFKLPAVSNLEINHWNALSNDSVNNYARCGGGGGDGKEKEEEQSSNPRTSNGFIHSDLSISSDEDDLFNISDLIYKSQANKSKSIDLNEFRKTFGSSPTLLNNFGGTNCNLAPQLSRLDAIPSQYRRGYTNLNDAGLSSSTSELECVNATTKKKTGSGDNGELSPLLKHRNNDHVAYVRSYENLNRYKAFSMKNGAESSDILRCQQGGGQLLPGISNLDSIADSDLNSSSGSGSNLIDDSFTDFEYRFSRLSCSGGHNGTCSSTNTSSNTQTNSSTNTSSSSNQNHSGTGATHRLHPLTDPNHRARLLYGHPPPFNNTSSPFSNSHHHQHHHTHHNNNNNSTSAAANYYFPSDESLFNIDSFFDDFVEIDTSDIFDNTEYINIGSAGGGLGASRNSSSSSSSKVLQKSNNPPPPTTTSSLLLPEILQQDELLLKTHTGFAELTPDELLDDEEEDEDDDDDVVDHVGAASAIRQIDAEKERELPRVVVAPLPPPPVAAHVPAEPLKSKKLRCAQCNRKLGVIMIMKCHCEKIFCAQHRYAEAHNCSYDFKHQGKKILERENPLVVAQKLPKI